MSCPPHLSPSSSRLLRLLRDWALPIAELAVRIAAVILAASLLLSLPLPLEGTSLTLVQALIVLAAVALIGIALYETLFYNHYRP